MGDGERGCHRYMPSDFQSGKGLELEKEATLGEELMIVFDDEDVRKEREKLENGFKMSSMSTSDTQQHV